ncbi:FIG000605: protein co-occurring with transport systems (COG1739) [hydrothermal vent metagenome]|uniref:FIG000605: protein co-occurring with transport systems (COG1739) n=1 Tax=hydrothermal vent metagenome TaxID=652676 RepID=A0A3B0VR48_9ZZZZ
MGYLIPLEVASAEVVIKKSRFIAYAKGVASREAAMIWLAEIKKDYPDARHHCWAYMIGDPKCALNAGMGDDGEPSGTAGKPILNVLHHKEVGDIMVIVIRYFGGIKLGAGGLTRAYSQAAQEVMAVLVTEQQVEMVKIGLSCDFSLEQQVRYWLKHLGGLVVKVNYTQQVVMDVSVPLKEQLTFMSQLEAEQCDFKCL